MPCLAGPGLPSIPGLDLLLPSLDLGNTVVALPGVDVLCCPFAIPPIPIPPIPLGLLLSALPSPAAVIALIQAAEDLLNTLLDELQIGQCPLD